MGTQFLPRTLQRLWDSCRLSTSCHYQTVACAGCRTLSTCWKTLKSWISRTIHFLTPLLVYWTPWNRWNIWICLIAIWVMWVATLSPRWHRWRSWFCPVTSWTTWRKVCSLICRDWRAWSWTTADSSIPSTRRFSASWSILISWNLNSAETRWSYRKKARSCLNNFLISKFWTLVTAI